MMGSEKRRWRLAWLVALALLTAGSTAALIATYQEQEAPGAPSPAPLERRRQSSDKTVAESVAAHGVEPGDSAGDGPLTQTGPATEASYSTAAGLLPPPTSTPDLVVDGDWTISNGGRPIWLTIPALGVSAPIEEVGLNEDGSMAAPVDWSSAGWFKLGYLPGQAGTAVIAGHLDAPGGKEAIFWDLHLLRPEDEIRIEVNDGRIHLYQVEQTVSYPYNGAPLDEIFTWSAEPRLALVTCQGDWSRAERTYADRLVVFARYSGEEESRPGAMFDVGASGDDLQ
jgi:hypothetical protein